MSSLCSSGSVTDEFSANAQVESSDNSLRQRAEAMTPTVEGILLGCHVTAQACEMLHRLLLVLHRPNRLDDGHLRDKTEALAAGPSRVLIFPRQYSSAAYKAKVGLCSQRDESQQPKIASRNGRQANIERSTSQARQGKAKREEKKGTHQILAADGHSPNSHGVQPLSPLSSRVYMYKGKGGGTSFSFQDCAPFCNLPIYQTVGTNGMPGKAR